MRPETCPLCGFEPIERQNFLSLSSSLFVWLISYQPAVLFSQNKPATSKQPAVLFSQNKSATSTNHQPNKQAQVLVWQD
jgi:hypothetical protein